MTALERLRLFHRYWSPRELLHSPGTSYVINFAGYQFTNSDVALQVMEWKSQWPQHVVSDVAIMVACDAANDDKGE